MERKRETYGVLLTSIQEMKFSKYLQNNPQLPAPNTITKEERKQLVLDWLALNEALEEDENCGTFHKAITTPRSDQPNGVCWFCNKP